MNFQITAKFFNLSDTFTDFRNLRFSSKLGETASINKRKQIIEAALERNFREFSVLAKKECFYHLIPKSPFSSSFSFFNAMEIMREDKESRTSMHVENLRICTSRNTLKNDQVSWTFCNRKQGEVQLKVALIPLQIPCNSKRHVERRYSFISEYYQSRFNFFLFAS